jgi:hypothetical protein
MTPLIVPVPGLVPVKTKLVAVPETPPLNVTRPVPASIVTPVPVNAMALSVVCPVPVYIKEVEAAIEIVDVPDPVPSELLEPALASVLTLNVPAFIVTAP